MTLSYIESKYKNFYAPSFELRIEDEEVIRKEGITIANITVSTSLNAPGKFAFTVNNAFDAARQEFNWLDDCFYPGKKVAIKMGYADKLETMIIGMITSIKINFPAAGMPQMEITGLEHLEPLMKKGERKKWKNISHSDIDPSTLVTMQWGRTLLRFSPEATIAKKIGSERPKKSIIGSGECVGIPEIRPGEPIKIDGLGSMFSQKYTIIAANHSIGSSGYKTTFQAEADTI